MEIKDMSMGVRGMSAGIEMDAPGSALVVVVGLQLQWWGRWEGLTDGGYIKEK